MKTTFLDFEQPVAELEQKIEELRYVQDDSAVDISEEISRLQKKSNTLTKDIYGKLNAWQISQVARHPQRPYTLDYIRNLFTDFEELHGDRAGTDIVGPFTYDAKGNQIPTNKESGARKLGVENMAEMGMAAAM